MSQITVTMTFSDQLCADLLCTAIESHAISYWADVDETKFEPAPNPVFEGERNYTSCRVSDAEGGNPPDFKPATVDYVAIRLGVQRLIEAGHSQAGILIKAAVNNDGGDIDIDVADNVIQFGVLGEIVYG